MGPRWGKGREGRTFGWESLDPLSRPITVEP